MSRSQTMVFNYEPLGPRIVVTLHFDRIGARLAGKLNRPNKKGLKPLRVSLLAGAIVAKRSKVTP
jgi:hypothetical protein